uniref:RNA helicase n=1 Tax=Globodera rostochiensis TaxID=31243 RepID=A0A914I3A0_GLORO
MNSEDTATSLPPKNAPARRPLTIVSNAVKSLFPAVSSRTLLRHYVPLSGALSHTLFAINIFSPSLYTRMFSSYDLAVSNAILFNAHLGLGFFLFFRPHMYHLWRWRRVEFSVFGSVMFNFGSLLCAIFVKGFLRKVKGPARATLSVLLSIFLLSLGRRYIQHIDQRTKLNEVYLSVQNQNDGKNESHCIFRWSYRPSDLRSINTPPIFAKNRMWFISKKQPSSDRDRDNRLPDFNPYTGSTFSDEYRELHHKRTALPVWAFKKEFFSVLEKNQCIILEAETGSGKTTQVPQWCVEWLRHKQRQMMVCCTQPRRLATVTVAKRVAEEMDVPLGREVGYSIRFEEAISHRTLLKYCTDGVLLAEASRDEMLMRYGVILLDEVHERTMISDVLMGMVKRIMKHRKELRVVVMSASLKTGKFKQYFSGCRLLNIPGRSFPVHITYSDWNTEADPDVYISNAVTKAIDIHKTGEPGDILIFVTGQEDVEIGCEMLEEKCRKEYIELEILPLFGSIQHEQHEILMKTQSNGRRRCIVSTNVAETSITIDGVVFVIDPGLCKRKIYDPRKKLDTLLVENISRASAVQRAGRAGRTRPGKCFRLYSEHFFEKILQDIVPEIKHVNLDSVVLRLKKCGIDDIYGFELMDAPSREQIQHSLILLKDLGALDHRGRITPLGEKINRLPVEPPLARTMLESVKLHCSIEVITICAMLSAPNRCFCRPRKKQIQADQAKAKFADDLGDHLTLLRVYNAFISNGRSKQWCYTNFLNHHTLKYAEDVRNQLINVMHRLNLELNRLEPNTPLYPHNILKALLAGSFMKLAYFCADSTGILETAQRGHYVTVESQLNSKKKWGDPSDHYSLHPSSVLFKGKPYGPTHQWILFNEAIQHSQGGNQYLQTVSVVRPEWLAELAPAYRSQIAAKSSEVDKMLKELEPQVSVTDRIRGLALRLFN